MKKIIAYVGSRRDIDSNTYKLTKNILENVVQNYNCVYEILTPSMFNIKSCEGCQTCFSKGYCIINDDIELIKEQFMEADFIIFSSPVYFHNVSGDFKTLLDRIAYWSHLLKFAGKGSVALTTNMSNGHNTTSNYLEKVLTSLGSQVISKYNASTDYPNQLNDDEWLYAISNVVSYSIIDCLENGVKATEQLRGLFLGLRDMMIEYKKYNINVGEWSYWEDMNYFNCKNFEDVLQIKSRS